MRFVVWFGFVLLGLVLISLGFDVRCVLHLVFFACLIYYFCDLGFIDCALIGYWFSCVCCLFANVVYLFIDFRCSV